MAAVHKEVVPKLIELGLLEMTEAIAKVKCRIYDVRPLVNYLGQWIEEHVRNERKARLLEEEGIGVMLMGDQVDRSKPASWDPEIKNSKFRRSPTLIDCVGVLRESRFLFNNPRWSRLGPLEIREYALRNYGGRELYGELDELEEALEAEKDSGRVEEIQARLKQIDKDLESMDERVYARESSIYSSLDDVDKDKEAAQYFSEWHLQGPGRIHTSGGAVWLPKLIRWLYIQPTNPENIALELDLKSCQLIIACKLLGCDELLQQVRDIAKRGESVWGYIAPGVDVPKSALKVLVYSLVFGCPLGQGMQKLVNAKLRADGQNFQFNQAQINEVLNGFLKPLVDAREEWMAKYSLTVLLNSSRQQLANTLKNASGHTFHLKEEAAEYLEQVELDQAQWKHDKAAGRRVQPWEPQVNESEIAGRALAHMCQGYEAFIMQSFIASEAMRENILAFQFDGMTVECHPNKAGEVIARYENWLREFDSDQTFEFVKLWFGRNWQFVHVTERAGILKRSALSVLEAHFEQVNRDPRNQKIPSNIATYRDGKKVHHSQINWLMY
jgi:hypothetical protein